MAESAALALYVAISCLAFATSKIIVSCLLYRRWRRKRSIIRDTLSGYFLTTASTSLAMSHPWRAIGGFLTRMATGGKFVLFRSASTHSLSSRLFIQKAMKLSNKDIIGSGGHGTVYKLRINDTAAFAVKRLNKGNSSVDRGFERELDAMGDIKHRNIVMLHGYYALPDFNFLVYELMPNGSLDTLLHGSSEPLDWPTRHRVAVGAARGLSYLHHDCIPHIIHRDIKSSNILLDQNMEARVSDFGLAALLEPNQSHVSTIVAGTFGYLAPEYFDTGRATRKGDVYSFGVVLLELLTGKRPSDESFIEEGTKLVTWVKGVIEVKEEQHAIDRALTWYPIEEVKRVFHIAEKCLESDPSERPTMAEVHKMLEQVSTSDTLTVP